MKIKISKSQWLTTGEKAGWLKMATIILDRNTRYVLVEHLSEGGRPYTGQTIVTFDPEEQSWMLYGRGNLTQGAYKVKFTEEQAARQVEDFRKAPEARENENAEIRRQWTEQHGPMGLRTPEGVSIPPPTKNPLSYREEPI